MKILTQKKWWKRACINSALKPVHRPRISGLIIPQNPPYASKMTHPEKTVYESWKYFQVVQSSVKMKSRKNGHWLELHPVSLVPNAGLRNTVFLQWLGVRNGYLKLLKPCQTEEIIYFVIKLCTEIMIFRIYPCKQRGTERWNLLFLVFA